MLDSVRVHQIDTFRAGDAAGAVAAIWRDVTGVSEAEAQSFAVGTYPKHVSWPGFRLFMAAIDEKPIGFIYGYRSLPGQWWHDEVRQSLIDAGAGHWVDKSLELAEIGVLPAFQREGVGTALIEAFLKDVNQPVLLAVEAEHFRAQSFYARHGFIDLITDFHYEGWDDPIVIMGRPTEGENG